MPAAVRPTQRLSTYALATVLMLATGASSLWGIVSFHQRSARVEHSYAVLGSVEALQNSVRAAESAARAFRITDRPAQMAEYLAAVPDVTMQADALSALVADHPAQSLRARAARAQAMARLRELQHLVDMQTRQGVERARTATLSSTGLQLMHDLDATAAQLRTHERGLLLQREAASDRAIRVLTGLVVFGTLVPLVLLGRLMQGLTRENRRVLRLEGEARRAVTALQAASAQRDRLSEQRRMLGSYAGLLQSCQTGGGSHAAGRRRADRADAAGGRPLLRDAGLAGPP